MPTFGTCANHGKTWYLLWWSLQMEDQAASSFTSSIITFSSFLSNPFKKVVCFFFFSRHPWNHTNCQGCSHRGRQSHNSGWRDRPTPGSRYKWIMLWHNDMLLHQHASNLEIKKLKWIFVDSTPPPWPLIIFSEILSKKSSTFSPGREEVVPTFALPWSTDPPGFPIMSQCPIPQGSTTGRESVNTSGQEWSMTEAQQWFYDVSSPEKCQHNGNSSKVVNNSNRRCSLEVLLKKCIKMNNLYIYTYNQTKIRATLSNWEAN